MTDWKTLEAMARKCIAEDWSDPLPGFYREMNLDRFAGLIRAQALEDAANECARVDAARANRAGPEGDCEWSALYEAAAAIRALKP